MSGRPGRSGGWNRLPVEVHIARGTYRKDKHGPWPPIPQPDPLPAPSDPPARLLCGLQEAGTAFCAAVWAEHDGWTAVSLRLLHEAGRLVDALEASRGTKDERVTRRELLATVAALRLA